MRFRFVLYFLPILFGSCNDTPSSTQHLKIAVAANAQFAFEELKILFEEETDIELQLIVSSSGKLTAQILQGAPFDLFISANMKYPQKLAKEGMTAGTATIYAYGRLVLWSFLDDLAIKHLEDLQQEQIEKIALANPRNAPYGEASIAVLKKFGLYETLQEKLVYGESIAQTNQYILSKAAACGFTAQSVVHAPKLHGKGKWIAIDPSLHPPIEQGMIITKFGQKRAAQACQRFQNFLQSPKAQKVLNNYGYEVPTQ